MKTSWEKAQELRYAQLQELWQRIDCLNEKEWGVLYSLVAGVLSRCAKATQSVTDHETQDRINGYFVEKILQPAQINPEKLKLQMPLHHGALIRYFSNYVISLGRKSDSQVGLHSDAIETSDGQLRHEAEAGKGDGSLTDRLHALGFSLARVQQEAHTFLSGMSAFDRALLRNYSHDNLSIRDLFPHSPQQQSLARVAMAQLGLWSGKGKKHNLDEFSRTRVGRFMTRAIGQPLDNTHPECMDALMSLLCELA